VKEESMIPLLYPGNTILVYRFSKLKTNDIVVLKNPYKNRKERYLVKKIFKITKKSLYVEGLNKEKSIDSRQFGWIAKKDVVGKMISKIS
jgi:phage repressor protein C with HTH and peptisase S24 domain